MKFLQRFRRLFALPLQLDEMNAEIAKLATSTRRHSEQLDHHDAWIAQQNLTTTHQTVVFDQIRVLIHENKQSLETILKQDCSFSELVKAQFVDHAAKLTALEAGLGDLVENPKREFSAPQLAMLNPRLRRNILPNDDAMGQKHLMSLWRAQSNKKIGAVDLLESGFRVFSQNDEDGVLLRIFSQIGATNHCVVEIGSNCDGSDLDIPENLSTNLIVNHGWHGLIIELDPVECAKMRYFFARDFATKHFHQTGMGEDYYSPLIVQKAVTPENINQTLLESWKVTDPDLMVIDIDGGDYAVMQALTICTPRVLVVEFEKRFKDKYTVVQTDRANFSKKWPQSGAASLPAWEKLLTPRGYNLCSMGTCGYNAFFVRSEVMANKITVATATEVFTSHPILSQMNDEFWFEPDESWQAV